MLAPDGSAALLTDCYQITMLAAYAESGYADRRAVFEVFVRGLPPSRRYMVSCGIGRVVDYLTGLGFSPDDLAYLEQDPMIGPTFKKPKVRALFEGFRFRGRVWAVPEGRVAFAGEPLVRVEGTLAEAQLVETLILSVINHDTRVASKCARITSAAAGRPCFEFGSRRTHERAAVDAARAAFVGGFTRTSNEMAGKRYGIPTTGTMAHAFVLAHAADLGEEGEGEAFAQFAATFSHMRVACLVDTFDTPRGVGRAVDAVGEALASVRIDSGDLAAVTGAARATLDGKGAEKTQILLSNDLDEYSIDELVRGGAPVDGFGVGTMAVSTPDAPALGAVYKLVALDDARGRRAAVQKRAAGKGSAAGVKQVYRLAGTLTDTIAVDGEGGPGEPLLELVFDGERGVGDLSLAAARARLERDLAAASAPLKLLSPRGEGESLTPAKSAALVDLHARVARDGRAYT